MEISFLEAKKLIKQNNNPKKKHNLKLVCSFEVNQLLIFLKAIYAFYAYDLDIQALSFNTLVTSLKTPP